MKALTVLSYAALVALGACTSVKRNTGAGDSVASAKAGSLEGPSRGDTVAKRRAVPPVTKVKQ
jgi:hypothetical protein